MTKYDELRDLYDSWYRSSLETHRNSCLFPIKLSNAFREYLGAPETFKEFDSTKQTPCVTLLETETNPDGELSHRSKPTNKAIPDLVPDENGFFARASVSCWRWQQNVGLRMRSNFLSDLCLKIRPANCAFAISITRSKNFRFAWMIQTAL
jgi:hypothetical protein